MGDSRRFNLFADLISKYIDKNLTIADIAGGKGYLQLALREKGFKNIVSWDKRHKTIRGNNTKYGYFNYQTDIKYDAVIGLHPDEATDHIVLYASKHRVPAIVSPCCVKPDAVMFKQNRNWTNWINHLILLANKGNMYVTQENMRIKGKNLVLIIRPRKKK